MMKMSRLWTQNNVLLLLGSSVFFAQCGHGPAPKNPTESKLNIVGGKPVDSNTSDARRLSTVALTTDRLNAQRRGGRHLLDQGHSFCTATIISPRVLMTAAHCIQDFDPRTNAKTSAFVLPSTSDFIAFFGTRVAVDGDWLRATEVIPHPDWSPDLTLQGDSDKPPHDIGIVILESEIPGDYQPVSIANHSMPLRENHPVTLVGYGVTRTRRNNNTGVLREVQLPLKTINSKSQILGVGNFMKGACAGDSGGPMYAKDDNGKWYVIGVTSAGIEILQNCIGLDNLYTDARPYKPWISATLAERGIELKD
jgi:V8-like Glu-specific endopeptidase